MIFCLSVNTVLAHVLCFDMLDLERFHFRLVQMTLRSSGQVLLIDHLSFFVSTIVTVSQSCSVCEVYLLFVKP